MKQTPSFLITIDVEGDNQWENTGKLSTKNSTFLYRFQELCDRYGFKPTYLSNYEMAMCQDFRHFGQNTLADGNAEIGMHLHPWNMPPKHSLTVDDQRYKPYLIEYPSAVIEAKVDYMTKLLQDVFTTDIYSHRAGRWGFNKEYANIIAKKGYKIDCSVTPFINWNSHTGDPSQHGGSDFSNFPEQEYFLDLNNISRAGDSQLLEIPVTIIKNKNPLVSQAHRLSTNVPLFRKVINLFSPEISWLRPNGKNLYHMKKIVRQTHKEGRSQIEFMLHSSELMPGGSPSFRTEKSIEKLYSDLDQLFSYARQYYDGSTLYEFYKRKYNEK